MKCPKCNVISPNEETCIGCGLIFEKFGFITPPAKKTREEEKAEWRKSVQGAEWFETWKPSFKFPLPKEMLMPILFFPMAYLFFRLLPWMIIAMGIYSTSHRMGHFLAAGFNGLEISRPTVELASDSSLGVTLLFVIALVALGYWAQVKKDLFSFGIVVLMLFAQVFFTFGYSLDQSREISLWIGEGSPLLIGTLLIISYHHWSFWNQRWLKYIICWVGSLVYMIAMLMFWKFADPVHLETSTQSGRGGMYILHKVYGWSGTDLINSYRILGLICTFVILAHYAYQIYDFLKNPEYHPADDYRGRLYPGDEGYEEIHFKNIDDPPLGR